MKSTKLCVTAAVAMSFFLATGEARGGFVNNLGLGLDALGFNLQGQRNPLSGGDEFLANVNFAGNPLDFGAGELTLQGPLSLQISTDMRQLPTLDIDFSTALNRGQTASPLNYLLNYDVGPQSTQISGSVLVDGRLSINGFGFYELEMTYSSRQEVENDGRESTDEATNDFDVGPINISGNIFADVLTALTDPLFDAAGTVNPFESFSGRAQIDQLFSDAADDTAAERALGPLRPVNTLSAASTPRAGGVVPEPSTIVLLGLGAAALFRRNW